ncbi:2Fe-2S iron-sulfur cluster-binding protein [Haliangium sp.]|uniref:2Fe-2S iron-sulfur cluster-binding protein n=1 Tax=Haliangium sp. TaxID=2663208 RepID=UPI003D14FF39
MTLILAGDAVRAYAGETVAVALHAGGHRVLSRSIKYHRPRAFFCLEGHCGGCLMRIGGVPNLRACMEPCRDGLVVEPQNAYPSADLDVLEAVDWLFPGGMNHHTLMTGSRLLNAMANKVVRKLSGLGRLPDHAPETPLTAETLSPEVLVIGAGPAGLAAATEAARAGAHTLLIDEHTRAGGSLLADPRHGPADAAQRAEAARAAGVELRLGTTALAVYLEDPRPCLVIADRRGAARVQPRVTVWATGGYAVGRAFVNNDRPGVLAARAVARMLVSHRVKPGQRVCVSGADDHALALIAALTDAGCEIVHADEKDLRLTGVRGRSWVTGVELSDPDGRTRRFGCDLVAVSATPAPASDGPRQHGCRVELVPAAGGFAVQVDDRGDTGVPGVLACGDVCGFVGPTAAAEMGARVGRAAVDALAAGGPKERT